MFRRKWRDSGSFERGHNRMIKLMVAVVVAAVAFQVILAIATRDTVHGVTVKKTERVVSQSGDNQVESKYLVFTDREVFENTDTILFMKFHSSDIYGVLEKGVRCDLEVVGLRVPVFSMYRNIIDARCGAEASGSATTENSSRQDVRSFGIPSIEPPQEEQKEFGMAPLD